MPVIPKIGNSISQGVFLENGFLFNILIYVVLIVPEASWLGASGRFLSLALVYFFFYHWYIRIF